ncbi:MAG: Trk system potassium transporter TrkA [Bacteroidetes bacterium]|jgi:trk system potassium uptake protein TrkA|nr:Trk system potassium transporter TrkA [Bacteroidota bacterium]
MRAIVIGAGVVGFDVAKLLSLAEHDVVVVDTDAEALAHVNEKLDVMTVTGNGTSTKVLEHAGIRDARILVAVTAIDEVNIIACMLGDRLGVDTTIARVRSDELTSTETVLDSQDFGIDLIIHPEESAAAEVTRLIRRASATDVLMLADDRLHLVGLRLDPDSPVIGHTLQDLVMQRPDLRFRVMAIARGIRTILPGGNERLRRNDQIFVLARPKTIPPVLEMLGKSDRRLQNIMILGGTDIGAKVALQLSQEKNKRVKLVESNRERAVTLAETLSNCLVIHGEGSDIDLLVKEGLSDMDAFVAVTADEESNLVTCLLAKHLEVRKTVALLSNGGYIPISQSIGLDAAVNTKLAVSREVMRFLRGKHVKSVATVHGLDAEILEIEARPLSAITKDSLMNLSLPSGLLIAAVLKGDAIEIATGSTRIDPGDRVYIFVMPGRIAQAEKLFDH